MPRKLKRKRQQGKQYTKAQREEIIQSLRQYLVLGYDLKRACLLATQPYTTIITWVNKDAVLSAKVHAWQNMVNAKARQNIAKSINEGDVTDSKWWAERREKKDFSTRTEQTGDDGRPLFNLGELAKQKLKELK